MFFLDVQKRTAVTLRFQLNVTEVQSDLDYSKNLAANFSLLEPAIYLMLLPMEDIFKSNFCYTRIDVLYNCLI